MDAGEQLMEQLHNQELETENTITRAGLRWPDAVIILLALAIAIAGFVLPTFAVEPKRELVTVTRFVCQPTPTAKIVDGWWRP